MYYIFAEELKKKEKYPIRAGIVTPIPTVATPDL